jgi:hypothetical protein
VTVACDGAIAVIPAEPHYVGHEPKAGPRLQGFSRFMEPMKQAAIKPRRRAALAVLYSFPVAHEPKAGPRLQGWPGPRRTLASLVVAIAVALRAPLSPLGRLRSLAFISNRKQFTITDSKW